MSFILEGSTVPVAALPATNILIVDDVPQNLTAMEALLAQDGVTLLKASSGAEALELLLTHEVALALLDVQMPEMDGFTLAEFMRGSQRTRDVPIIFLTASPNDPARSFKGYETGAVDFLHKPIEPRVILGKVAVFIQLHQQRLQLKEKNERLERALALNESMIAVLTHDLRTPLAAITLCADKLREDAAGTPMERLAFHVETSAERMARMIEQLLDFSRIRSDILRLDSKEGDLGALCEEVVNEMRRAHPGTVIELSLDGNMHGTFDAVRMSQVVSNLLGNAVQYAQGGEITVHANGVEPGQLKVSVRNHGHLPEALVSRIFEPFKGGFHHSKGLGLGLYIVDQFVRAHGGRVLAENDGAGVHFEARIPRKAASVPARGRLMTDPVR